MSRITEREVNIPSGVEVVVSTTAIRVKGKHGELSVTRAYGVSAKKQQDSLFIKTKGTSRHARAMTGPGHARVQNMI